MIHKLEEIESFQNYQNEFETDKAMLLLTSKFNAIRTPCIHENILIEKEGVKKKQELLAGLDIGQVRKGIVRKITHYGAFVDIGGFDGLLRIADMSWCRISHPSEMLAINDEIEVKILDVDREGGKVALGLKQKYEGAATRAGEKHPVGSRALAQVINIMPYGVFVKLESGVKGLVHNSEMSWTRYIANPLEMVNIGDTVGVVVIKIEEGKIGFSMKQTHANPWPIIKEKYPPGAKIMGRVRELTEYNAIVEIEAGVDGYLHTSDMSWTKKISNPSEIVKKGDEIEVVVLSVDCENMRISLGIRQLTEDLWEIIKDKFKVGDVVKGKVNSLAKFGAFIEISNGVEGLLHVSELSNKKVKNPAEVVNVGDELNVRIVRIEPEARRIGLSQKGLCDEAGKKGIKVFVNMIKAIFK